MMTTTQQTAPFSGLLLFTVSRYSFPAVAKSAAGRENPSYSVATPDAPCVFFCVYAYVHLLFTHRFLSRCCICVMVAQAGQPSGWPVPIEAGFSPPSGLPPERENSGGSVNRYSMEVALMATTLTPSHPQFVFVFAAVRHADLTPVFVCFAPLPVMSTPHAFLSFAITSSRLLVVCRLRRCAHETLHHYRP